MKASTIYRLIASLILLSCVWLGYKWAISLSITLLLIQSEITGYILNDIINILNKK